MSKYYTPEIEEFHPGFEYEAKASNPYCIAEEGEWIKLTYTGFTPADRMTIDWAIEKEIIRVKHLDREDIESLGFKHDEKNLNYYKGDHKESYVIDIYRDGSLNVQFRINGMIESEITGIKIKNKSELKRILKQIGL